MSLKKWFLITLFILLVASACGGRGATSEASLASTEQAAAGTESAVEPASPPATSGPARVSGASGSFFAINEVGLGPDGFVALTNFTDVPVSLGGLYLCQGADCFALPDEVVEAGETVRVAAGDGQGLENVVATQATFGELQPADGEIAIFTSDDTEDAEALLVYLQWGSTPHELTKLAVDKGLWFETSYAPSGPNATRLYRVEESGLWLWEQ